MSEPNLQQPEQSIENRPSLNFVLPGAVVVVAMFVLGISATSFLWFYWTARMTPFMPLQEALEREFPNSAPRAEGGHLKDSGRSVLQVVLRSDFDPRSKSEETRQQIEGRLNLTRSLANELADLPSYEVLAMHLYYPLKERGISQKTFFRDVATWEKLDAATMMGFRRVEQPVPDGNP